MCQTESGEFCPIFSKNAEYLKMAVKNFPQTFGRCIGANFFYLSIQIIDQVRKRPFRKVVTELRFLTQLLFSYFLFTLGPLGHHYSSPRNNCYAAYIRGGRMGVTAVASLCCVLLFRTFTQTKRSAAMKTITYPDFDNVGIIFCMVI